ncbi:MAG: PhzF family phenazine biosynthesis protein [Acidobacteria bacterium]|nr:PhzF family phenazine biosynthesis protein [Acidobacteriota bacterium]
MLEWHYATADVFTHHRFRGNQLAVFADARGLSDEEMQAITREMNYSETVFVFPATDSANTCRLRIFTPGGELPFAGHPTVGTAIVLAETGVLALGPGTTRVVLEEGVGPVPVSIMRDEHGRFVAELTAAQAPERLDGAAPADAIAQALSLATDDFAGEAEIWSCGVPFTVVPLRDRAAMGRIRIDTRVWADRLASSGSADIYVVCRDAETPGADVHVRMFAPLLGVIEDPATGSAAAALAGWLGRGLADGEHRWLVEQGIEMGRTSFLQVTARVEVGRAVESRVGGNAVVICRGTMKVR